MFWTLINENKMGFSDLIFLCFLLFFMHFIVLILCFSLQNFDIKMMTFCLFFFSYDSYKNAVLPRSGQWAVAQILSLKVLNLNLGSVTKYLWAKGKTSLRLNIIIIFFFISVPSHLYCLASSSSQMSVLSLEGHGVLF